MPVQLHPLEQIVNVSWGGGGVFIAGDLDSNIYYLELGDKMQWRNLGKLDFHQEDEEGFVTGRVAGSAYAIVDVKDDVGNVTGSTPVFVLVGGQGFANEIGIIMASHDGLNWKKVFTFAENRDGGTFEGAGIFGVVWDKDARMFYAGGHQVDNDIDAESNFRWEEQKDLLFQSSDGYSWTEAARHTIHVETFGGDPFVYPDYKTGLLARHCSSLVKDSNNNGIPDGNYAYKPGDLLIAPTDVIDIDYLFGIYLNKIPRGQTNVTVTSFGGEASSYPSDTGIPITCSATVGGRWMVAGGVLVNFDTGTGRSQAAILTPSASGYEWESLNPTGKNIILTMTAGTISTNAGL